MTFKNITPLPFICDGGSCPAVYETDRGTYLVIGKRLDSTDDRLSDRLGTDKTAIEVPAVLIHRIAMKPQE